jgi:hypothetical protein
MIDVSCSGMKATTGEVGVENIVLTTRLTESNVRPIRQPASGHRKKKRATAEAAARFRLATTRSLEVELS